MRNGTKKVLLTGCSASQSSSSLNERMPTFAGLLSSALIYAGHEVIWDSPRFNWDEHDLADFDVVIVGLTPPTSVASYRLYGALSVIEIAKRVTNVRYLVDAPEPNKLWNGLRATANNPGDLVKDFYNKRPDFNKASQPKELDRLQSVVLDLFENEWERTIVPAFPWFKPSHITNYIPNLTEDSVEPICLDSVLLTAVKSSSLYMKSESDHWVYDSHTRWVKDLEKTIKHETRPMVSKKWSNNGETLSTINKSIGSIIATYKNNDPWWSMNLSQSLFINTPVVTDWRHTSFVGPSWSVLAHQIEEMTPGQRSALAVDQKNSYIKVISSFDESIERVLSAVFED